MSPQQPPAYVAFGVRLIAAVYLALGILGFLPVEALNPLHHEGVGARYLFNLVAINWLHNLVHLAIGLTGLWSPRDSARARLWGRAAGLTLLVLFVIGMAQAALQGFPPDQLLLGLIPLNSPGHMLHLTSGLIALYLGLAGAQALKRPS